MEKAVNIDLLEDMWKMYLRQKGEEGDAGRDTKADTERMSRVFKLAARGVLTDDEIDARFPDPPPTRTPGVCLECHNTGMLYTRKAKFKFRGSEGLHRTRTAKGMEVCGCFEGRRLREAIKKPPNTGRKKMRD